MRSHTVLISGASIAGPALAGWLGRNGYDVTVVERSPAPRPGGQAVDFKGATHRRVLERMGVWDAIGRRQTPKTDWRLVDAEDRVRAVIPGDFIGGDVEILRGDLAAILRDHSEQHARYEFGDEIVALQQRGDGVTASFKHRDPGRYDLVIGADGVHSAVRRLAFGPEDRCVRDLGYCYAVASGAVPRDGLETRTPEGRGVAYGYTVPNRLALLGGQKAPNLFVFRADAGDYDRHDRASQLALLEARFAGVGWRVPAMLAATRASEDFFLDGFARTRMTAFTAGRVALVGDAGYANTLGGFGTGLAIVGAYVLAGELVAARGEFERAFAAYDRRMGRLTRIARGGNAGPFLAPPSRTRIRLRDWSFANRASYRAMTWLTDRFATDETVPDYALE